MVSQCRGRDRKRGLTADAARLAGLTPFDISNILRIAWHLTSICKELAPHLARHRRETIVAEDKRESLRSLRTSFAAPRCLRHWGPQPGCESSSCYWPPTPPAWSSATSRRNSTSRVRHFLTTSRDSARRRSWR